MSRPLFAAAFLTTVCPALLGQLPAGASADTAPTDLRRVYFREVGELAGVAVDHDAGLNPDVGGSGAAWIDFDDDGDEDLFVLSMTGKSQLFRYDGGLAFVDVTAGSGLAPWDALGVSVGDFDADGLDDLYVANHGLNNLYRNLGGGRFLDVAPQLGVAGSSVDWSQSSSWADFDRDGDLDLYVGNYVGVFAFPHHVGQPNRLFENAGASPWPDVATAAGVDAMYPYGVGGTITGACTLVTNTLDYDEDGDADLQVGNDFGEWVVPNLLYRNDTIGAIAFADQSAATGFNIGQYCMGIKAADYDHDGDWDFYSTDIGANALLQNNGGVFTDVVYSAGPIIGSAPRSFEILKISSWAVFWQDVNLDSWEDLVVINGFVPAFGSDDNLKRVPNHLWLNQGDGTFVRVPDEHSGVADEGAGRSAPHVDLNRDGNLDLYVTNNGTLLTSIASDRNRLFMGTGIYNAGDWLELDLRGRISHPNAYGARIDAVVDGTTLKRQLLGDGSYLDSPSRVVHLGLGPAKTVDELRIAWPSGIVQTLIDTPSRQRLELLEPAITFLEVPPASFVGADVVFTARIRNHDAVDHVTTARLTFSLPTGEPIASLVSTFTLPAGAERWLTIQQPLAGEIFAHFASAEIAAHMEVSASGGIDQRVLSFFLP